MDSLNARARAPDVTLFLEVSPRTAIRRRLAASATRELFEEPAFQRRVARAYRQAIAHLARLGQRVDVVDGERSPEDVTALLASALQDLLK